MATVASSSDQAADLLQNFSLDSETNAVAGHEYGHKGLGDNGSVIYSQNYGYTPYGIYPSTGDVQLQGLQQYHYPSPYYQPNQGSASQGGGSTSVMADKVSLSVESNKDNPMANGPGVSGNGRSKPQRPNYQYPYLDPNSSHGRGGLSTVVPSPSYQDPGYSFDGIHSPITWLDTSIFGGGQSKHNANAGYTSPISHSNNFPSGRNQNHRPHLANFHHTRPTSDAFGYMSQMYANNPMYGHYGNTFRAGPGYGSFGYDSWISGRGWYPVDSKYKPRGRGYGASGSGKENVDGLNELNKGPRAKGFKNQEGFDPATVAAKGQNLKSSESTPEDNLPLIPDKEKYSGEDFPESYSDAKFFIIKSYSEDDVHKSVKYNMWTSTPNGNKKLDAAYREAKEKSSDCPVFLLFSVNASGQFVGVAEMVGPVDFDKTVEYWQQDKWVGCFPLKWHIIKDVSNSSLRHITLENNENKPVTNSRDTQEVNFEIGIQILKIFKSHSSKRCILDDFGFYEARERIMQQKKAKQHQLQRQVSDGKPSDVIIDDKDKDAASAKDRVQKSQEETLVKELALIETIGDVKKLEENGSAATVEDAVKGAKSAVSSGKKGMNKMVINHLDKLFVTNDAATIVNELEVQHPAAKLLVLAGKAQQEEIGDGANLTISFAGEILQGAEELIRMGLHPSEIISGYTKAINKTIEILEELVEEGSENMDVRNTEEVIYRMKAAVASKQFGQEEILCPLIADACIQVCPKNPANFNVDNVRVAKLLGGGLHNSTIVRGMVLKSDAVGSIKNMEKAKVAVFAGGVDTSATETKGTVLIHNAEQLENYAKTEEAKVEGLIKAVAESGAKVIVSGAAVGEMALHFCERYKLMVLKISSKFELRRFCRTTGAVAMLKLCQPNPDDLGYVDSVSVEEIGGARVTIVRNEGGGNSVSTVVLRGSTDSILDDLERAVDDGVNTYKAMCRDSRIVPGAAATEIELARRLKEFSFKETGLDQYAIAKFAESFEMVPKTLAENAGLNAMEIISSLYAEHASGKTKVGIDLENGVCADISTMNVWDLYVTKFFALKYAADAACTVLRVDQIIMAKPAGGPRRDQQPGGGMDED